MTDTNVGLSKCIQEQHGIGATIFHNICDGSLHSVSWGGLDWFIAIVLVLLGTTVFLLFAGFLLAVFLDSFR